MTWFTGILRRSLQLFVVLYVGLYQLWYAQVRNNKHCEVLVSCSDWVDFIDFIELHAFDMLSKYVISTACQLLAVIRTACNL